ncbi:MAG: DUF4386 domain-containing protein [Ignavibacteriae bacterium]|nr:DUF4386 domain-containing protein [Ignavibacteriota bacterium]
MILNKNIGIIVGSLFIITIIAGMLDAYLVAPLLKTPLENILDNENYLHFGALLILVMAIGIVGIAIFLFPILKKYSEVIAITYLSFRILECVLLLIGTVIYYLIINFSKDVIFTNSVNPNILIDLFVKLRYLTYQIAMVILGLGSIFLCYLFYQTKLIPRFLSVWGIIGYLFLFLSGILDLMGIIDTVNGSGSMFYIIGGIWELFLFPVWLILKGFNVEKQIEKVSDNI